MKNVKRIIMAAAALLSFGSVATLVQPGVPTGEDMPVRLSAGLKSGVFKNDKGVGVSNLGLGIGLAHNVGYDFEYGLAVSGDWAAGGQRLFTKEAEKHGGAQIDVELMARFMPELAESFRFGGVLGLGWGNQFGGEAFTEKKTNSGVAFGDLGLRAGPALSYAFTDLTSLYFGVNYTLTGVRFAKGAATTAQKDAIKASSNLSGVEAPLGLWFSAADNVGIFLEANTRFLNVQEFTKSWKEEITAGVSFAI